MSFTRLVNPFALGILGATFLGWLLSDWGARGGALRTEYTTLAAVFLIFFNQGLTLPSEELKRGFLHWRFHLFCFLYLFLFFPVLTGLGLWALSAGFGGSSWWLPELAFGFFFLALLPTTITTAVILTAKSGGSVSAALFTTAFTNVAGIFLVPVLSLAISARMGLLGAEGAYAYWPVIRNVLLLLFLPLVIGQFLRPLLKARVETQKKRIRKTNEYLILFIVFAAFAQSFQQGTWEQFGAGFLLLVFGATAAMLLFYSGTAWGMLRILRFTAEDRKAGFFCSAQKTLAAGIPLAGSIFAAATVDISLIILPLMIYHVLQLVFHGYLAGRWEATTET